MEGIELLSVLLAGGSIVPAVLQLLRTLRSRRSGADEVMLARARALIADPDTDADTKKVLRAAIATGAEGLDDLVAALSSSDR